MSHTVTDAAQRAEALDPIRSFCVTAPAGSGKTELLIQRYLTLLARVEQPQEVLAITFTRKAATEMRGRIMEALATAAAGAEPADAHAAQTFRLARQVLQVDASRGWLLQRSPSQLNIRTIDSFCGALTRQMPVLSRFGGPVTAVDDGEPYYREATRMLLEELDRGGHGAEDLASLLLHFDNNWNRLEDLLVEMLACRDQWLVYMGTGVDRNAAQVLVERSIELVCRDALSTLDEALAPWRARLALLWQYSRDNRGTPAGPAWPGHAPADVADWHGLASLLLTGSNAWRRQLSVRDGFPPGKGEAGERKAEMRELLQELAGSEDLLSLLVQARQLPTEQPGDAQWERMMACTRLLPQLAARLLLVFQQHGVVDHTQVSLAALDALGEDDAPTELALKLDYRLQHILVDEFQDTAVNQFELVRRLTRGWAEHNAANPGAARTLFIVGDGMQSIYGFRDADVGLFIKAKQLGFDNLALEPLVLRTNFRSSAGLVNWVNRIFNNAFPAVDDIRRGEIAFSSAAAFDAANIADAVTLAAFPDDVSEAAWIAERISPQLTDPGCESIAVLVRRKADLAALVPELKSRGIAWQAQEIDALGDSVVVRDLSNLCRALYNPIDRVAWLALLRAPWCGIDGADLLALAAAEGSPQQWLLGDADIPGLTADGRLRLQALRDAMRDIFTLGERMALRDWLEFAWLRLGGPGCVEEEAQLEDADAFFAMLAAMEANGESYAPELLQERVSKLFARSSSADSKLQLMTLHKAKGLEFDVVYIPNLGQAPRGESRDLLLWDEYHALGGESCFMLAMDDQATREDPTLYNYLYQQRRAKRRAESTRLLYVGVTRAARELCLSARLEQDEEGAWKPPAGSSLLATVWNWVEDAFATPVPVAPVAVADVAAVDALARMAEPVAGRRLTVDDGEAEPNIPERGGEAFAAAVGSVIHLTLERLAQSELPATLEHPLFEPWWRQELALRGVGHIEAALQRVRQSVDNVLGDERGRWLLSRERREAVSELAVSCLLPDGRLGEYLIDRTFLDAGERWVVDFKSSVPDSGQSLEDFVAWEAERYRPQLDNYRALMLAMEDRPVRCALYFTAVPCWHELE